MRLSDTHLSAQLSRRGSHLPSHGSKEVLLIFGSLTTCDPGNLHDTIDALAKDGIRVNVVGLAAELKVLKDISMRTNGASVIIFSGYANVDKERWLSQRTKVTSKTFSST